jgi:limonene-1,2-epoxide hydrolase
MTTTPAANAQLVRDFLAAMGSEIMSFRIMGAIELRDGKITRYGDYFDTMPARAGLAGAAS